MKTVVCPECGGIILVAEDNAEVSSRLVCESCFATLEITAEDPIEVIVVDIDVDELDDDDYDDEDEEE